MIYLPTMPRNSAKTKTEASILSGNFISNDLLLVSNKSTVHIMPKCEPTVAYNSVLKISERV